MTGDHRAGPPPAADRRYQLPQARVPTAAPAAAPVAVLAALGLVGVAVVAGREFLLARELVAGPDWVASASTWLARLRWQDWMDAPVVAALVLGVVLLVVAVTPRARVGLRVRSEASLWMRPVDVARMCTARVLSITGAVDARTTVTRRKVVVRVTVEPGQSEAELREFDQRVRASLSAELGLLAAPPRLRLVRRVARPSGTPR